MSLGILRQKAKGNRQKAKGKRQKAKGKRQKAKGKRQEGFIALRLASEVRSQKSEVSYD
ncbi:MAG: hypothetical protein F6J98_39725 [Moorea sp. SIO4G2]|nr:hypothetical protein [Moorena sp. SIO4G2]